MTRQMMKAFFFSIQIYTYFQGYKHQQFHHNFSFFLFRLYNSSEASTGGCRGCLQVQKKSFCLTSKFIVFVVMFDQVLTFRSTKVGNCTNNLFFFMLEVFTNISNKKFVV